jgi:hypothetical protein
MNRLYCSYSLLHNLLSSLQCLCKVLKYSEQVDKCVSEIEYREQDGVFKKQVSFDEWYALWVQWTCTLLANYYWKYLSMHWESRLLQSLNIVKPFSLMISELLGRCIWLSRRREARPRRPLFVSQHCHHYKRGSQPRSACWFHLLETPFRLIHINQIIIRNTWGESNQWLKGQNLSEMNAHLPRAGKL